MSIKPWKRVSSKLDESFPIFNLRTNRAVSPRTGKEHDFFILESRDWVNIIPLINREDVILIRQFRHGTQAVTLEIPGGIVEAHQTPEEAARRELLEETGYSASEMVFLGMVYPNPAFLNNRCHTFLAPDISYPAGEQELDDKEDIEVIIKPLFEIPRLIRKGEINHSLIIAAFYRLFMEYWTQGEMTIFEKE